MAETFRICWPLADLHQHPRRDSMRVSQALFGEEAARLESHEGWARVKLSRDAYEGWVEEEALGPASEANATLTAKASHIYPAPDIKSAPVTEIHRGARLHITGATEKFSKLSSGGFVFTAHLHPCTDDPAAIAAQYLGVPYLWGGKTSRGLDCSGLVQIALQSCGIESPRDSGPQEQALGRPLAANETPARNDLIFWKGHVGILADAQTLIHANAFHMQVVAEDYTEALTRIGAPSSIKRLS